jgi:hypothetical protein
MKKLLEELAYKWCVEYGDKQHHLNHHTSGRYRYSWFCGNCHDGLEYAKEVRDALIERLKK